MIPIPLIKQKRFSRSQSMKKNNLLKMIFQVPIKNLFNIKNIELDKINKKYNKLTRKEYFKIGIMNL